MAGGGGGWSGSAHVTHTAYLTDDLVHDKHGSTSSTVSSAVVAADTTRTGDRDRTAEASMLETIRAASLTSKTLPSPIVSNAHRHAGFWGVWEPVLGRAGNGGGDGGDGRSIAARSGVGAVPDGWKTTLNRRGGAFRFVPKR